MGTIVEQGVSVVIRKASDAIPLKTSPGQPHAHSSTAYRPAECGLVASRTARSRHATSEFTPRDQPSHRVPRRSTLDRYPHPACELDHRCRHGTRSRPECVSNRSGEHAGQPCSRQGRLVRAVDRRSPPLSRQRRRDDAPSSRRCWATDGTLAGSDWRRRSLASRATSTAIIRVSSPNYEGKCGGVHRTVGAVQLCGSLSRRRSPLSSASNSAPRTSACRSRLCILARRSRRHRPPRS